MIDNLHVKRKNWEFLFKIISISSPIVLVLLIELVLRIFNYGFTYSLFIKDQKLPGFYTINPDVGRRYFFNLQHVPSTFNESFRKEKSNKSYRIFVLGESTARGYPYINNGSFHRMLKYRLDRTFPDKNIQIINLAITGINSYTLLDFTDEIIQMNPDAILIYAGHNEFYGAFGVSSNQSLGFSRSIVKEVIRLKKFKVVQIAFDVSGKVKKIFSPKSADGNPTLMQQMAKNQSVVFGSKIYNLGLRQFEENSDELLKKYDRKNIPVFLSDIVSNEKGQKPFINRLKPTTDTVRFMKEFRKGLEDYKKNELEAALKMFIICNTIDSSYAINNFLIGEILYSNGDFVNARNYYLKAKEFDALRFRAPEAINTIIYNLSKRYKNVHFVDVRKEFINNSDHGILDNKLFTEHLHPTLEGYFLISDAFYNSLKEWKMFGSWDQIITADSIQKELPVSAIDTIYGKHEILQLRQGWPFNEKIDFAKFISHTYPENLVGDIFLGRKNWTDAMYELRNYYLRNGNEYEALQVLKGLELQFPYDLNLEYEIAQSCLKLKQYNESLLYFDKAFALAPNVKIAKEITIILFHLDRLEESVKYLEFIIKKDPSDNASNKTLMWIKEVINLKNLLVSEPENITILNYLADFYLNIKNLKEAKIYIDKALGLNAKNAQLLNLLDSYNKLMINQ